MPEGRRMTRRGFLSAAAAAGGAMVVGAGFLLRHRSAPRPSSTPATLSRLPALRGRVVLARDDRLTDREGWINPASARRLLDEAVRRLVGTRSARSAWRSLFSPRDRVGIKVNCLAGRRLSSQRTLVEALVEGIRSAGVDAGHIFIWERSERELMQAGFEIRRRSPGPLVIATDSPGVGYQPEPTSAGEVGGCLSRCLTDLATAVVSVPVLKDHDLAGVSLGMKNFFGAINNPNKYHHNHCDPYIADLMTHPQIRGKLRLTVCDGGLAQCEGGPAYAPKWAWRYNGIIVSCDPVALDAVGRDIITEERRRRGLPSLADLGRQPSYIPSAEKRGLGVANPSKIELIQL